MSIRDRKGLFVGRSKATVSVRGAAYVDVSSWLVTVIASTRQHVIALWPEGIASANQAAFVSCRLALLETCSIGKAKGEWVPHPAEASYLPNVEPPFALKSPPVVRCTLA